MAHIERTQPSTQEQQQIRRTSIWHDTNGAKTYRLEQPHSIRTLNHFGQLVDGVDVGLLPLSEQLELGAFCNYDFCLWSMLIFQLKDGFLQQKFANVAVLQTPPRV